jgi:hypothetical protein
MEPLEEIKGLLDYLVKHNEDHAGEIMELASRVHALGNVDAHHHITTGVELLRQSNENLRMALLELGA